jgi:hypothetical protein
MKFSCTATQDGFAVLYPSIDYGVESMKTKPTALLIGLILLGGAATAKADSMMLSSKQMDLVTAGHRNGGFTGVLHQGFYWRWYNNSWHQVFGTHLDPYYYGKTGLNFGFKKPPSFSTP